MWNEEKSMDGDMLYISFSYQGIIMKIHPIPGLFTEKIKVNNINIIFSFQLILLLLNKVIKYLYFYYIHEGK